MGKKKSTCRRCGQPDVELCNSHIIPESAYEPVYDDKSRALYLAAGSSKPWKVQHGAKEYLFCKDCEGFFNKIETPFLRFWKDRSPLPGILPKASIQVEGVDYENSKRFLLSILWRAHVSTLAAFSNLDSGKVAANIRALLDSPEPIPADVYPTAAFALRDRQTQAPARNLVITPTPHSVENHPGYVLAFLGIAWLVLAPLSEVDWSRSSILSPGRPLVLQVVPALEVGQIWKRFRGISRA